MLAKLSRSPSRLRSQSRGGGTLVGSAHTDQVFDCSQTPALGPEGGSAIAVSLTRGRLCHSHRSEALGY